MDLFFWKAYFAFNGYGSLSQVVEEVKEPLTRTIPLAVGIAMVIVTSLYILANLVYNLTNHRL